MRPKKVGIVLTVAISCLLSLAGCSEKKSSECVGESTEEGSGAKTYQKTSKPVLTTDNGCYYYSIEDSGFRYVDTVTGKEMFLCNKPECKHDGDVFCAATNERYTIDSYCLYNNKIYVNAVEETDTQYLYKVLTIEMDGSELNEVCTYLTLEKTEQNSLFDKGGSGFVVHKDKMLIPLSVGGQANLADAMFYGGAVLNLENGEVDYLDEEPLSKENGKVSNLSACGEYFYYWKKEGKTQKVLHRYHLTEKIDESIDLLTGFTGNYVVLDDNTVIYQVKQGLWLCKYDSNTGENEKKVKLVREEIIAYNGTEPVVNTHFFNPEQMKTDGEYVYVTERLVLSTLKSFQRYLHIYNAAMEEVAVFDYLWELEKVEFEGHEDIKFFYGDLWWSGEDVVCVAYQKENMVDKYVFRCKKADLLEGEPKFKFVCMYTTEGSMN